MKILIIGGGVAGASAARFLAKHFDVTLIQDKVWAKPCGGGVKTKVFDEFDIPKKLILHYIDNILMHYKQEDIRLYLKGKNLSIVNRKEFDSSLRDLAQKAGAKVYFGRFKTIKDNKAVIEINKEKVSFEYDIIIGADGVNSTLRKTLNLPPVPKVLTYYSTTTPGVATCNFYFDKETGGDFYAWAFPLLDKAHIGSASKEGFFKLCKQFNTKTKPKGYFIPSWQENIIIQKENAYFVGDAAGQVMPLSFEGIYYAIHSAKILSQSIIEKKNYRQLWNKSYLKKFRFMKKMENLLKNPLFRNLIIKAHKFEIVKSKVIDIWLSR
ncbi:MAG: NAD(P)/FAD-dependent oxidoreductase [Epsilonproteobacteria bacterium]|nr:NAD(P)/FAD-dependent oxidoreductase [Campylobacterota bacterium]